MSKEARPITRIVLEIEKNKIITESKASGRAFWPLRGCHAVNNSMLKWPGGPITEKGYKLPCHMRGKNDTFYDD